MATDCISRSKDVCQYIKFAARKQVIDVCIVPNQSATDQNVVPLLPLRKILDGSQGMLCRYALRVQIQNLNFASRNSQLHQGEAILKRQRRNKRALQFPKRRVNVLIFQRTLLVFEFAKQNPNLGSRKLADHFEIGKTQIQATLKNKEAIIDNYASTETAYHAKRKRLSTYSDVNLAMWDWYTMCRNSNIPVSGSMLQEEATLIAEKLEISDFVASNGRLEKFKQKYIICNKTVAGEAGDVSKETMEIWKDRAREITTGWNARDFWNMDETGCFWRGLPEKTIDAKGRRCTGGKKAKQRLTWAFFVNAEGEKEDTVVIGTSVSPRCFKNSQSPSGPYNCSYFANSKAWMNTDIMATILRKLNRQLKRNDRHILLFMDNAPCHPQTLSGQFSNITVQFLPKNTTSQHHQIKATRCRYNLQLEGPLQKTNAALPLLLS